MSPKLQQIEIEAMSLPEEERGLLALKLIKTLDGYTEPDVAEVEEAWDVELARRVEEVKAGKVEGIPAAEVERKMRANHSWLE